MKQLSKKQLELLKKCDGKHNTMLEIFNCKSCAVLIDNTNKLETKRPCYCDSIYHANGC